MHNMFNPEEITFTANIINVTESTTKCTHMSTIKQLHDIYEQKNAAYGNSFDKTCDELGIIAALTRMSDKWNRLVNLVKNSDIDTGDEAIEDTLLDLANYSIMTYMWLQNNKEKETK